MAFSKVLAPLYGNAESAIAMSMAAEIAAYFRSHVEVISTTAATAESRRKLAGRSAGQGRQELSSAFETWRGQHRLELQPECTFRGLASASLVARGDPLETALRDRARFSDLVCLAMEPDTPDAQGARILQAVLFSSGRPVLLRPAGDATENVPVMGEPIAIGWNGSVEAVHAVAGALPFIQTSRRVEVISIGEKSVNAFDAYELVKYLAWSGVQAGATGIAIEDWKGGDVIDAAVDKGAKLLVMGAHERGNATSHMLRNLPITALMAA